MLKNKTGTSQARAQLKVHKEQSFNHVKIMFL